MTRLFELSLSNWLCKQYSFTKGITIQYLVIQKDIPKKGWWCWLVSPSMLLRSSRGFRLGRHNYSHILSISLRIFQQQIQHLHHQPSLPKTTWIIRWLWPTIKSTEPRNLQRQLFNSNDSTVPGTRPSIIRITRCTRSTTITIIICWWPRTTTRRRLTCSTITSSRSSRVGQRRKLATTLITREMSPRMEMGGCTMTQLAGTTNQTIPHY